MLLFALTMSLPPVASGAHFQSTEALDRIVEQFTGKRIGEAGGAKSVVDKRLKLANCAAPQLSWRTEAQDAVVVRCMEPAWRIFVNVDAPARTPAAPTAASAPVANGSTPVAARAAPAAAPIVIKRGDPVLVEIDSAGFSISRDGIAMADAPAGGRVPIKIDDKKPPIQAIALEPGRAAMPGWTH